MVFVPPVAWLAVLSDTTFSPRFELVYRLPRTSGHHASATYTVQAPYQMVTFAPR
jgi:hypothetical protein